MYYKDDEFKAFCRRELIHRLMDVDDSDELKYFQLLQQLLILENAVDTAVVTSDDNEIFVALFNRWALKKQNKLKGKTPAIAEENRSNSHAAFTNISGPTDFRNDQQENSRSDLLQKLLSDVCKKQQYLKHLKILYNLEQKESKLPDDYVF